MHTNQCIFQLFQHIVEVNFDISQTCEEVYHSYHNDAVNTSCSKDEELDVDHQRPEEDMNMVILKCHKLHGN